MNSILIIDDNAEFCDLCAQTLANAGFDCTTVYSPLEAIKLISKVRYNGIVVDTYMPDINGPQLIAYIKSSFLNATTPIVSVSGEYSPVTRERVDRLGVLGCLSKPFRPETIVELFNQHLGIQQGKVRYDNRLIECFKKAVKEGLSGYLGEDLAISDRGTVLPTALVSDVLSYLPLFGKNIFGSLVLRAERSFLEALVSTLFGKEPAGISLEALGDLGAELANQVGGVFKQRCSEIPVHINLGLPNTSFGIVRHNYHFVSTSPYQFLIQWKGRVCCAELALSDFKQLGSSQSAEAEIATFKIS